MSTSGLPSIERLEGSSNYDTWRFDMECILTHEDLYKYVESAPDLKDATAKRGDDKARTKICLLIENSCKVHVRNAKTAKEAWDSLKSAYQDKGINNRCRLLSRLVSLKLGMFESITSYVTELMRTANKLQDIGKEIDDELLAAIMLQGLPDEYAPLRLALESTNTILTTDFVKTKLLQLDEIPSTSTTGPSSALTAAKPKLTKSKTSKSKGKTIKCFICDGPHKACDCPQNPRRTKSVHVATALSTTCQPKQVEEDWILDSGASAHMSNRIDIMRNYSKVEQKVEISCANGGKVFGEGFGMIESDSPHFTASNVMYVPDLSANLLSISCIVNKGKVVIFSKKGCEIFEEKECKYSGTPCMKGDLIKGVYKLKSCFQASALASTVTNTNDMELWHRRLAHLGVRNLLLLRDKMATGVSFPNFSSSKLDCVACILGKQTRQPFDKNKASRANRILGLVHTDICGPIKDESMAGFKYFITFIDDYSRKTFVYFLKHKSEAFEKIKEFKSLAETQTGQKLKVLRSDNGGEYVNKKVDAYLREHGIQHQLTIPYTPQQNGVAERANRTIAEKARSMLQEAGLPARYWAEAVNTAVYLKNRSPTLAVKNQTPEERWTGRKTDLSHLKVFGCRAFKHIPDEKRTKLDPKSCELVFVGYCEESKGYRLIDFKDGTLHRARDVVFLENQMYNKVTEVDKKPEPVDISLVPLNVPTHVQQETVPRVVIQLEEVEQEAEPTERWFDADQTDSEETQLDVPEMAEVHQDQQQNDGDHTNENPIGTTSIEQPTVERRYPLRDRKPKFFPDFTTYKTTTDGDPLTVEEALSRPDSQQWRAAIKEELDALHKNETWTLVKPEHTDNIVDSKWLFRIKKEAGNKIRYKARLVARGFSQRRGIDYDETFSPVVRHSSLRLLFALAANLNLKVDHMDVKTAFLNGTLDKVVYMKQPRVFQEKGKEDHVCLLHKSLYGLKQAPRAWNIKLHTELENLKFKRCENESCVYTRTLGANIIFLAVYVDDILIFYNNAEEMKKVKQNLMSKFEMKDLGKAQLFLGMRIVQGRGFIKIDQAEYIEKLLHKFGMDNCKTASTPAVPGLQFSKPDPSYKPDESIPYRELIGSLMYVAVCTRPDIAHSVNVMSQFCNCYSETHWIATKRILRYLKGTITMGLVYSKEHNNDVEGFADADHAGNIIDRRSYSGNVFRLAKGAISWQSTKQKSVAISTAEAEYVSLSEAAKEAVFLAKFLKELQAREDSPINLYTDSQSAMAIATNPVHHQRTKHVDVRYHFTRELVDNGVIKLMYLNTSHMVADVLTKAVPKAKQEFCRLQMGVMD